MEENDLVVGIDLKRKFLSNGGGAGGGGYDGPEEGELYQVAKTIRSYCCTNQKCTQYGVLKIIPTIPEIKEV